MSHNTFGHLFASRPSARATGPPWVRGGRVPAADPAHGRGDPGLSRQAPPRHVALHDPASRAGRGEDPLRVMVDTDGVQKTTAPPIALLIENVDQRSKDYTDIAEKYRAGPRGFHLRRQVRHPRLPRRRALLPLAKPRRASRRGASRARSCRASAARRAGADGTACGRPGTLVLGDGRREPVLLARTRRWRPSTRAISTASAKTARPSARSWRSWRRACPRPRRADLRQARRRYRAAS